MPYREGEFPLAAKFFHRLFQADARVKRVPSPEEIAKLEKEIPGTRILPQVKPGMWLSLPEQDSYSFAVAYVYMAADDQETLVENYNRVIDQLEFEFERVDDTLPRVAEESLPPA